MKRKAALLLAAVMAASSLPMTAYAANFKDINDVPWSGASEVINTVADLGLCGGYEDNTFRARNNVTYCEAMQMVYKTLQKSGAANTGAVDVYNYVGLLTTYNVPSWAHPAVAYGLQNEIIDLQTVATKFVGGSQHATREDVAAMFGNAMKRQYGLESSCEAAYQFNDSYAISKDKLPLVDLLKRLNIITGDNNNRFYPQGKINRAEMAVMLNKTYSMLKNGTESTAEITEVANNEGVYFYISTKMENGDTQGFHATDDTVKVYDADGNVMSLRQLSKGDKVRLQYNSSTLNAIYVVEGATAQQKYDVTGFITSFKTTELKLENENTGEKTTYKFDEDSICYLDNLKISRSELREKVEEYRKDGYAYAGLMVNVEKEKNEETKEYEYTSKIKELYVTLTENFVLTGKVDYVNDERIRVKPEGSVAKDIDYDKDCEFYIGDEEATISEMEKLVDGGTMYVKVTLNKAEEAIKIIMSEDAFDGGSSIKYDEMQGKTVELANFTEKQISVRSGGKAKKYNFDSSNPIENIRFYWWDSANEEFDSMTDDDALDAVEDAFDAGKDVYCQLDFNSGGRITSVELSKTKGAWAINGDQTERKGTVASLENGVLKFTATSGSFEMLSRYNVKIAKDDIGEFDEVIGDDPNGKKYDDDSIVQVKYPLKVSSAVTSSLKVFEQLANDDAAELYAEIVADDDNKVVKVDARLKKITGTLVKFVRDSGDDPDEDEDTPFITIKTDDGEYKLKSRKNPAMGCDKDDDDAYTVADIASTKYNGCTVELEFDSNGRVNKLTIVDDSYRSRGTYVSGIAEEADANTVTIDGKGTFRWWKNKDFTVENHSLDSTSRERAIEMIKDPDIEVYLKALIGKEPNDDRVEGIDVYIREATGKLVEYGSKVKIETATGRAYSFFVVTSPECDVNGITTKQLLKEGRADGKQVTLTFNDDGWVESIKDAK